MARVPTSAARGGTGVPTSAVSSAEVAYRAGVPRAYRPEVAMQIYRRSQKIKARKKKGKPRYDPSQRPTREVLDPRRGRGRPRSRLTDPILPGGISPQDLVAAYVGGNQNVLNASLLPKVPGIDIISYYAGTGPGRAYTAGAGHVLTGAGVALDRLVRLGAPVGEGIYGAKKGGLGGALRGVGTGFKRVIDKEPYRLAGESVPETGIGPIDFFTKTGADIVTNPASFLTLPVSSTRTAAANIVRAGLQSRFLGRSGQAGGAYFGLPDQMISQLAGRIGRPAPMVVPGLPGSTGRALTKGMSERQRFNIGLERSPYPFGTPGRRRPAPEGRPLAAGPQPEVGSFVRGAVPEGRGDLARALTAPEVPGAKPGVASLNRLMQRLNPAEARFTQVAGPGVRTPSLVGARRMGAEAARRGVQIRTSALRTAKKAKYTPGQPKLATGYKTLETTNVPGLVGTRTGSKTVRQRAMFGVQKPPAARGGATYGVEKAGTRPLMKPPPPESFVPTKTTYKGQKVTQVERYQVVKSDKGFRIRDAGQRKMYGRTFKTETEAIKYAQNLASRRIGAQRAAGLNVRRGLPPRVKPREVPYSGGDLRKLRERKEAASKNFREAVQDRVKVSDLPKNTIERVGRLRTRAHAIELELKQLRRKILKMQGPAATGYVYRTSAERQALQKRHDKLEQELESTYEKIARSLSRTEKGKRDTMLDAYDEFRAARDAERNALANLVGQITAGRRRLLQTKPTKSTREPTKGQRELLRPAREPERPLSQPPPGPTIEPVMAKVDQVLRMPYPARSTKRVEDLKASLADLERKWIQRTGASAGLSPTRAMREGSKIERLRIRTAEAETKFFHDRRRLTPQIERPAATFGQKKKYQEFHTFNEMEELAKDIIKTEKLAGVAAKDSPYGLYWQFPGFGIPIRIPRYIERKVAEKFGNIDEVKAALAFIDGKRQFAKDMLVSRYGPNEPVGIAARTLDSAVQSQNNNSFLEIQQVVRSYMKGKVHGRKVDKVSKDDLRKISHWIETREFDDELSDSAKELGTKLSQYIERLTDEYLQAGGDMERLGSSYVFHMIRERDWADMRELLVEPEVFVFGNRPKFTYARPDEKATIRSLLEQGFDVEENIAVLTYMRAAAHNRAMADLALSKAVTKEYAIKAKVAPSGHTFIQREGLRTDDIKRDIRQEKFLDVQQQLPVRNIFSVDSGLWVPNDVAKTLLKLQFIRQENAKNAYKALRRVNAWWKSWALATTGYDIRNQVGDMILLQQANLQPVRSVIRGILMLRASERVARTGPQFVSDIARRAAGRKPPVRRGPTYKQLRKEAESLGVSTRGVIPADVETALSGAGAVSRGKLGSVRPADRGTWARTKFAVRRARVGRENVNRLGAFGQQVVSKKKGPYGAAKRVNEAVFDYGDVGELIQRLRTNPIYGMPFVTWLAKNIPAQVKRLPSRANVEFAALNRQLAQASEDPQLGQPSFANQPEFLMQRLALPIPGLNRFAYSGQPQPDLNRVFPTTGTGYAADAFGALQAMGRQWAGDLGPIPQSALAILSRQNPLTGDEFGDRTPASSLDLMLRNAIGQDPIFKRVRDAEGKQTAVPATGAIQKWLMDTVFPPAGQLSRITRYDAPDQPRIGEGALGFDPWQLLSSMGGLGTRPFWDERQTRGAVASLQFELDEAKGALRSNARDQEAGGQKVNMQTDNNGFIVSYEPSSLKADVIRYNRILAKLLASREIYKGIKQRG